MSNVPSELRLEIIAAHYHYVEPRIFNINRQVSRHPLSPRCNDVNDERQCYECYASMYALCL